MKTIITVIAVLLVAALGAAAAAYSGWFDVSASHPHAPMTQWLLHTVMEQSVRQHAHAVPPIPADLDARLPQGAGLFRDMCAQCHGAPGVDRDEVGQGLMPQAPDLTKGTGEWKPAEVFWIIKNGIRLTGMPAWGGTHSDDQVWALTAAVLALPTLTPDRYRELSGGPPHSAHVHSDQHDGHHHTHRQ